MAVRPIATEQGFSARLDQLTEILCDLQALSEMSGDDLQVRRERRLVFRGLRAAVMACDPDLTLAEAHDAIRAEVFQKVRCVRV